MMLCPRCGAPTEGADTCRFCRAKLDASTPRSTPSAHRPNECPFRDPSDAAIAFDPQVGFIAVCGVAVHGQQASLRAWVLTDKRVLWDALAGQRGIEEVTREQLYLLGRNVYVALKRRLVVLDLVSGAQKWVASLPDDVETVADPFPPTGRGAVLVATIDHQLSSFDRDSGQPLWTRSFEKKSIELQAVEGTGACLVRYGFPFVKVDIVNPAYAQPVASLGHDHWSTDLGLARLEGRSVITVVDDMGPEGDDDGLLGFDAVTGQRHFFEKIDDLEDDDVAPCAMGARVFAATDDKLGIYVGPRGRVMPVPIPNHEIAAFCPAGPALALLLKKAHGTAIRRVVGIDPHGLAFRFDAGEAGVQPEIAWEKQMKSDGYSLVFVASDAEDERRYELRSVDTTTGRPLWKHPLSGSWGGHRFLGGHLVVRTDSRVDVLSTSNGQLVTSLSR